MIFLLQWKGRIVYPPLLCAFASPHIAYPNNHLNPFDTNVAGCHLFHCSGVAFVCLCHLEVLFHDRNR